MSRFLFALALFFVLSGPLWAPDLADLASGEKLSGQLPVPAMNPAAQGPERSGGMARDRMALLVELVALQEQRLRLERDDVRTREIDDKIRDRERALMFAGTTRSWWSVDQAMTISSIVLLFGIIVIVIAAMLVRRSNSPQDLLRTIGTLLIVVCAVFLVVAGYSDQQIAPVMGLLGTIAGYILGRTPTSAQADAPNVPTKQTDRSSTD